MSNFAKIHTCPSCGMVVWKGTVHGDDPDKTLWSCPFCHRQMGEDETNYRFIDIQDYAERISTMIYLCQTIKGLDNTMVAAIEEMLDKAPYSAKISIVSEKDETDHDSAISPFCAVIFQKTEQNLWKIGMDSDFRVSSSVRTLADAALEMYRIFRDRKTINNINVGDGNISLTVFCQDLPEEEPGRVDKIIFRHGVDDYSLWEDFSLTEEEERVIAEIFAKHETDGWSVRGSLADIVQNI